MMLIRRHVQRDTPFDAYDLEVKLDGRTCQRRRPGIVTQTPYRDLDTLIDGPVTRVDRGTYPQVLDHGCRTIAKVGTLL